MAVFTGIVLSGSTNGKPVPVAATSTPGTNIHTAGATGFEEVYLWAANVTATPATLTVEWGGTSDPGDLLVKSLPIPNNSLPIPLALGLRVQSGVSIKAFASTGSAINITGYANKVL